MLKAIVIEGINAQISTVVSSALSEFPEINSFGNANSVSEGKKLIRDTDPDIVFLDLELPDGNGLDVLRDTLGFRFQPILISDTSSHFLRAAKFGIADYVRKELCTEKVRKALVRALMKSDPDGIQELFSRHFRKNVTDPLDLVAIPSLSGTRFLYAAGIKYAWRDEGISNVVMANGEGVETEISLKSILRRLGHTRFFRLQSENIFNREYVRRFSTGDTPEIVLEGGISLEVHPSEVPRLEKFLWNL